MIAVDASALVAIALGEPEADAFQRALEANEFAIGWPTLLEARIALEMRGFKSAENYLANAIRMDNAHPVAFGEELFQWAEHAFQKYGKGKGHPARLNYGDCMAYAVAKEAGAPLLFKGADFQHTDLDLHPESVAL